MNSRKDAFRPHIRKCVHTDIGLVQVYFVSLLSPEVLLLGDVSAVLLVPTSAAITTDRPALLNRAHRVAEPGSRSHLGLLEDVNSSTLAARVSTIQNTHARLMTYPFLYGLQVPSVTAMMKCWYPSCCWLGLFNTFVPNW